MLLLPAWTASKASWRQFLYCLGQLRDGKQGVTLADGARVPSARLGKELEAQAGACLAIFPVSVGSQTKPGNDETSVA